jgi:hypothetical protein
MLRTLAFAACLVTATAATGHADDAPPIATYAIVVGSNSGGPGQADLHYAEDDARRVANVLSELGGYSRDQVDVVVHPTPDQLRERIAKLGERIEADRASGRQARIFFYYSGHARASAIDLGADELPLAELRERLFKVQATLTVVVLDACQSGAFSRIKGAQPAADFSFNSRQHLDATGVAVLASSSGSELSQESEQLRSSYFTHHLLVGLRGAGDANHDGQVSLDEAYRYAYHQTLLATAETAVGGQHVTFEADLKGHGEVPLSFPRAATASIELPATLEGKTLVEDRRAKAVVAETYKAKGGAVRIAVAPGDYDVLVRHGTSLSRCAVSAPGAVDLDHCTTEAIVTNRTKGGGWERPTQIEVGVFGGSTVHDAYTANLEAFGYSNDDGPISLGLSVAGLRRVADHLMVGGVATYVGMPMWSHSVSGEPLEQTLESSATTFAALARADLPFFKLFDSDVSLFGQIAAGLGVGRTSLKAADSMTYKDTTFGPALAAAGGLHITAGWFPSLGFNFTYGYEYAPIIKDLLGNTHSTGGTRTGFALTYSF